MRSRLRYQAARGAPRFVHNSSSVVFFRNAINQASLDRRSLEQHARENPVGSAAVLASPGCRNTTQHDTAWADLGLARTPGSQGYTAPGLTYPVSPCPESLLLGSNQVQPAQACSCQLPAPSFFDDIGQTPTRSFLHVSHHSQLEQVAKSTIFGPRAEQPLSRTLCSFASLHSGFSFATCIWTYVCREVGSVSKVLLRALCASLRRWCAACRQVVPIRAKGDLCRLSGSVACRGNEMACCICDRHGDRCHDAFRMTNETTPDAPGIGLDRLCAPLRVHWLCMNKFVIAISCHI